MSKYLSVVAKSGQVNTPPGSYVTVKEWARNSFINPQSTVLEVGCSSGFITIETARYTGATCIGVDLHEGSIASAQSNIDSYIVDRVSFLQGDAAKLPFKNDRFSHVIVSGHLPFVPSEVRRAHITEALRVLKPWGHLLVALYFYHTPPPREFVDEFNAKIGTKLSPDQDKTYWGQLFEDLPMTLEYESEYDVLQADEARVQDYIDHMRPETQENWSEYLQLFNRNGQFLSYFVRVYRKVPDESNLMLQIPRGGIYSVQQKFKRQH